MYRAALRSSAPRIAGPLRQTSAAGRRFASTVPADRKRGFKSSVVRLGLAIGAVYWYSTNQDFFNRPTQLQAKQPPPDFSDEDLPTVEAIIEQKRKEAEARLQKAALEAKTSPEPATAAQPAEVSPKSPAKEVDETPAESVKPQDGSAEAPQEGEGEGEEGEKFEGAFNPETGEINWDCPCLGGMAHGPCGEEFKAAFSCFVYSKEEPKGMDCIDKFQHMQDCFRLHPEIYGEELAEDEEAEAAAAAEGASAKELPEEGIDATAQKSSTPESSTPKPTNTGVPSETNGENLHRERDATDATLASLASKKSD